MRLTSASLGLALEGAPDAAAAAAAVVDHVARERRLLPAVYLARGGRLRCAALAASGRPATGCRGRRRHRARRTGTAIEVVVPRRHRQRGLPRGRPRRRGRGVLPVIAGGLTSACTTSRRAGRCATATSSTRASARRAARCAHRGARAACRPSPPRSAAAPRRRHGRSAGRRRRSPRRSARCRVDLGPLTPRCSLVPPARRPRRPPARGRWPRSCAPPLEPIVDWVQDGTSCFTVGAPDAPPAANRRRCARPASRRWSRSGSSSRASSRRARPRLGRAGIVDTDDVQLLEQLATHGAACLRTAELCGSLRERAETDPLTGLGHHATFHDGAGRSHRRPTDRASSCATSTASSVLNDTYGHGQATACCRRRPTR